MFLCQFYKVNYVRIDLLPIYCNSHYSIILEMISIGFSGHVLTLDKATLRIWINIPSFKFVY